MLKNYIRDVPNFPKKGVIFKDITTLLKEKNIQKSYRPFSKTLSREENR